MIRKGIQLKIIRKVVLFFSVKFRSGFRLFDIAGEVVGPITYLRFLCLLANSDVGFFFLRPVPYVPNVACCQFLCIVHLYCLFGVS